MVDVFGLVRFGHPNQVSDCFCRFVFHVLCSLAESALPRVRLAQTPVVRDRARQQHRATQPHAVLQKSCCVVDLQIVCLRGDLVFVVDLLSHLWVGQPEQVSVAR